MGRIRQHPLAQPVAVLAAIVLVCVATVVVLSTVPHQARLERWLGQQPGVARASVSEERMPGASDWSPSAGVAVDGPLTLESYARFSAAYESYTADHGWATTWPMVVSDGRFALPVSTESRHNQAIRDLLARLVSDPGVVRTDVESRYVSAIVVQSTDPVATRARVAGSPGIQLVRRVIVIAPGEVIRL